MMGKKIRNFYPLESVKINPTTGPITRSSARSSNALEGISPPDKNVFAANQKKKKIAVVTMPSTRTSLSPVPFIPTPSFARSLPPRINSSRRGGRLVGMRFVYPQD